MPTTFEAIKLVFQIHATFENLRRDMRANAQSYIDQLATKSIADIIATANENTQAYHRLLGWAKTAWDRPVTRAKIQSALAGLDIPQAELTDAYTQLKAAADDERLAINLGIVNSIGVTSLANGTLNNLSEHESVWPNG